ncbi:MAG TPA: DUF1080 domain-containing protein [Candidatus Aquilonibacter sp.]|nr:DUF1080 domain-containing protein [Candidatus Aquilonibacter sp.]
MNALKTQKFVGIIKGFFAGVAAVCLVLLAVHIRTSSAQQAAEQAQAGAPAGQAGAQGQGRGRGGRGGGFHEPAALDFEDHTGYTSIFDGTDLKGWDGDPSVWHVEDGAIVGLSTPEHPAHSFISYKDLVAKDLDLKLEIKVEQGGGSGIQYRSKTGPWPGRPGNAQNPTSTNPDWLMTGPQADFWFPVRPQAEQYTGQFYTENSPLGIIAWRGEVVEMGPGEPPQLLGNIQDRRALGGYVKTNDWNQYEIVARGGMFVHILNGQLMAVLVDDNADDVNNQAGIIGIEIESAPCKVSVRNIWVKKFD